MWRNWLGEVNAIPAESEKCGYKSRMTSVQVTAIDQNFLSNNNGERSILGNVNGINPIHTGLFGWRVPGRDVFHLHPITPLSLTSDDSNFVQNYSGVGSIFWGKKNQD